MEERAGIIWLDVTDSTNDAVRRLLPDLANLSVVAARKQTAGRGQGDHSWTSAPGENLTFTWLLRFPPCPAVAASEILLLTQTVTRGIREYLMDRGVETRIKWPNDIYAGDRKICGILIENILDGKQVSSSILGIGLNLNQLRFPADLPNPVSLRQLTGLRYDPEAELNALWEKLKESAALMETQAGRISLGRYFDAHVFYKGAR
ncbi:MAG: biotin--[Bacteroidales bacterium]|nr:biotin--[acetyl-CoA-carboxylase] ligase [Bacteroidales bacterium]